MLFIFLASLIIPLLMTFFEYFLFGLLIRENELKRRYRFWTLMWGIFGATAVIIFCQANVAMSTFPAYPSADIRLFYEGAMMGPLIEEAGKAIPVLVLWLFCGVKGKRALLVAALISGIGFALSENILYLMTAKGADAWLHELVRRAILTGPAHGFYIGFFGLAVGFASLSQSRIHQTLYVVGGFVTSFLVHALNNAFGLAMMDGLETQGYQAANQLYALLFLFYLVLYITALYRIRNQDVLTCTLDVENKAIVSSLTSSNG